VKIGIWANTGKSILEHAARFHGMAKEKSRQFILPQESQYVKKEGRF
jgi:hypothetical protein